MNDQRFENTLKSKLTGLSTPPPESWWADIEATLPTASASPGKPPHRHILLRHRVGWAMSAACGAVAIVIASIVALRTTYVPTTAHTDSHLPSPSNSLTQPLTQAIEGANTTDNAPDHLQTAPNSSTASGRITPEATETPLMALAAAGNPEAGSPRTDAPITAIADKKEEASPADDAYPIAEERKANPHRGSDAHEQHSGGPSPTAAEAAATRRGRAHDRKPAARLYMAGFTAGQKGSTTPTPAPYQMGMMQSDKYIAEDSHKQPTSTTNLHEKHLPPFALGADVEIPLAGRWRLQTGLAYAMLASTFTQQLPAQVEHQKAHFVGIPLRIAASVIERPDWNVYLAAGGEWEKCVAVHTDLPAATAPERPHQWSLQAAAGGEYRCSRRIALYLETGVGYYFDNGTTLRTAYQAHPANFSLKLGVRFSPRSR